jgi:hypothetical protein
MRFASGEDTMSSLLVVVSQWIADDAHRPRLPVKDFSETCVLIIEQHTAPNLEIMRMKSSIQNLAPEASMSRRGAQKHLLISHYLTMMKKLLIRLAFSGLFPAAVLPAQVIDFETLPDGSPLPGRTVISNQFAAYGVTFQFEDGSLPRIARVHGSAHGKPTAFWGPPHNSTINQPAAGQNVGINFLTDDGVVGPPPPPLIISYTQPVAAASGFILDIDHQDSWDIEARNAQTQIVAQVSLRAHTTLAGDGIATPWSFARSSPDIASIRIVFTGNTNGNPGLAFDNFSVANPLPKPAPARVGLSSGSGAQVLTINGTVGAVYRVDYASTLDGTNATELTSIVLESSSFSLTNLPVLDSAVGFFRVVGVH